MRRIYLSFLGTSDYVPCNYCTDCKPPVKNIRFVQEATVSWHCATWDHEDRILILTTPEAHSKNWEDNGHRDRDGNVIPRKGLESRLRSLDLRAEIRRVDIPSGKNEDEIWDIFSRIVDELEEQDELYLDITHAFRSLPLLATVVINYAKVMKDIRVNAIDYGAMEAVGSVPEICNMDPDKRNIPVFDLLPFDNLLDWTTAIDIFLRAGDAGRIEELTEERSRARKIEVRGPDAEADSLRKMAERLGRFSRSLATCRGKRVSQDVVELKKILGEMPEQTLIPPLSPLLVKLEKSVAGFTGSEVNDGIAAARWCLEHNLIQQGFTLLQETMLTHILAHATDVDTSLVENRDLVGKAIAIEAENIPLEAWDKKARENEQVILKIRQWLYSRQDLLSHLKNLSANRNDLNHAGMKDNPMAAEKFGQKLGDYIEAFSAMVLKENNDCTGKGLS